MLEGKNILLGVCGSIASYKSATIVRLLVKAGANVRVIMTKDATHFITPLTLSTLSKNPVLVDYFNQETGEWNNHVELAAWANLILIAPASANTLAKFSGGLCDNLLAAVYLSAKSKIYLAPAMDLDMWKHPATQRNIHHLESYGNVVITPAYGELASGLVGEGRLAEPEDICRFIAEDTERKAILKGKKVLITAGPTYEAIDPVRFIGNHSSGKMGFAIAEELFECGADVTLITGPTHLKEIKGIRRINITSSQEMLKNTLEQYIDANITIMSAAVADYRPKEIATEKIKKDSFEFAIELVKTTDILHKLGELKTPNQILIGFALETENEEENAIKKLTRKNLDFIVLNSLKDIGAGFKSDLNKITIIDKFLKKETFPLKSKKEVAMDIRQKILDLI